MTRTSIFSVDWGLLTPVFILVSLSLTTLFAINITYFVSQLIFFVFSLAIFFFLSNIEFSFLRMYTGRLYIWSILLLLIVFLIGFESRGAIRWIDILGFRIQFSEILKPVLAFCLASFLSSKAATLKTMLASIILLLPIVFLIFLQPDLGNALMYTGATIGVLIVFGFPYLWFLVAAGLFAICLPLLWNLLREYQKQRIITFINPTADPQGVSYNVIQSMIAVGSGLFFGRGLTEGTQSVLKFLPERHTDFIFATLSEGLGFLGSILVVICFVILFFRIYILFQRDQDIFVRLFFACSFFLLLIQTFANIGMNIGIVPVVGVTLPFVSYGGSSLLANFILLGMLSSFSKRTRITRVLSIGG